MLFLIFYSNYYPECNSYSLINVIWIKYINELELIKLTSYYYYYQDCKTNLIIGDVIAWNSNDPALNAVESEPAIMRRTFDMQMLLEDVALFDVDMV